MNRSDMSKSVITGTGCSIPEWVTTNNDFHYNRFFTEKQEPIPHKPPVITKKFQDITGIEERRYAKPEYHSSDLGFFAAQRAIEDSGVDPESLDQIIFAHNFGDVQKHTIQTDILPALASRVKAMLKIENPFCVAHDILFGCPGWVQGVIHAHHFFAAGAAKKALVIGGETLSRVLDMHDRDSMIFSDGAGACVLEKKDDSSSGIVSTASMSHCVDESNYLFLGKSNFPGADPRIRYIKMHGRKIYEYALKNVPLAMKKCLDDSGASIDDLKKVFIHQANQKLDEGVIKRFYRAYGRKEIPEGIMPMTVNKLGNSSVATVPTLFDQVCRGLLEGHEVNEGDLVMFASVGAGMNINAICYRI